MAEPDVLDLMSFLFGPEVADAYAARVGEEQQHAEDCAYLVGYLLARDLANHFRADFDDTWSALRDAPGHMLHLLATPYGFTAFGEYVAAQLGEAGSPPFIPAQH